MHEVVITAARRTPVGSYGGALKDCPASELGGLAIRSVLEETAWSAAQVDEVIMGNVLSAGLGQNPARQMAMNGGVPQEVPAITLNKVCGSGLRAVILAAQIIKANDASCILCGGAENMSRAPYLLPDMRWGSRMGNSSAIDSLVHDGLSDVFNCCHMGITAENVAKRWKVSREQQDRFSFESHQKALKAQEEGAFQDEIVPVTVLDRKGNAIVVDKDEHPRQTSLEKLTRLKPAFLEGGSVTAGNASGINDGAAAIMVMSREAAQKNGLRILASLRGYASVGVDPAYMGYAPAPATKKALKMAAWKAQELDLVELNEAFASQAIAVIDELELDPSRINVNGGAIALGHPIGCSGARILTTLLHAMHKRGARRGLAALCIGGGMGTAVCVEREHDL